MVCTSQIGTESVKGSSSVSYLFPTWWHISVTLLHKKTIYCKWLGGALWFDARVPCTFCHWISLFFKTCRTLGNANQMLLANGQCLTHACLFYVTVSLMTSGEYWNAHANVLSISFLLTFVILPTKKVVLEAFHATLWAKQPVAAANFTRRSHLAQCADFSETTVIYDL